MSHKPKHPHNNPPANPHQNSPCKETNNHHVFIEPGAKIDLVDDLKKNYEAANESSGTHGHKSLFWARIATISTVLYFIVTGFIFVASKKSADAAASAADTAKNALAIGQRPWIGPNGTNTATASFTDGAFEIKVVAKNYGQSPALRTDISVLPFDYLTVTEKTIAQACKNAATIPENAPVDPGMRSWGETVFPGGVMTYDAPVTGTWMGVSIDQRLALVGCIAYVDQFHETPIKTPIHFTQFCFKTERPLKEFLVTGKRQFLVKPEDLSECYLGHMAD